MGSIRCGRRGLANGNQTRKQILLQRKADTFENGNKHLKIGTQGFANTFAYGNRLLDSEYVLLQMETYTVEDRHKYLWKVKRTKKYFCKFCKL